MADAREGPPAPPPPARSAAGPLAAAALVLADALWPAPYSTALSAAAALLLLATARRSRRVLTALAALLVVLQAAATIHQHVLVARWPRLAGASVQGRLSAVEARARSLVERLQGQAAAVAARPEARAALAGDRAALTRLFRALDPRCSKES
ncbi:MAG: hypothetical protein DMF78_24465 [Acidobacteria bacterium]|nr:MAG: hypothetical protein DMF78_24465 [Acidobacteriota bacterium]